MKRKNLWSEDEINYLKDNFYDCTADEIASYLGRTVGAVHSRAGMLGLKKIGYSDDDLEWLKENYPTADWNVLTDRLGRPKASIVTKASKLGLKRTVANSSFTPEEDELIRTVWVNMDENEFVATYLPHRTTKAVQAHASKIGVRRRKLWTEEEDELLRSMYKNKPILEMVDYFPGHSRTSIYNRMTKLGLTDAPTFAYSDKDIEFIRDNYLTMTDAEIGAALNRRAQSIKECRRKHKLYRLAPDRKLTYPDIEKFLHTNNKEWRKTAMEYDNYKCALTGAPLGAVHHIYGNSLILEEFFEKVCIPDGFDIQESTEEEREYILNAYLEIENKYPMGICLSDEMHKKFHHIYGYGNNTPEQFYEFVNDVAPDKIDRLLA